MDNLNNTFNEKEVLRRLALGEESAFKEIFDRYALKVTRCAHSVVNDSRLAQDIVQDVFSIVWTQRERVATVNDIGAYIYKMTYFTALYTYKRRRREFFGALAYVAHKPVSECNAEISLIEKENEKLVEQAVSNLPPMQKKVYELSRYDYLTHREIADRLSLSQATVSNHMSLALSFIREKLRSILTPG